MHRVVESKDGPRRRPKQGGYARGDETRAQIIATALRVFGEQGYDQASTREIAAEAGVNPPALQYYFGGKEGLHRACAQFIVDRAAATLSPALERAAEAIAAKNKAQAREALDALLDALTDSLAEPAAETWSRFVARGKRDGAGPGIEIIVKRISNPTIESVTGLVGIITDADPSGDLTRLRTLMVLGQVHWVHASREHALKVMRWSKLDPAKVAMIKRVVREQTRAALNAAVAAE
jgi:TetR/AcrR family transcriptional regulator, regulator of cefoperazone and chloramphenicol sensitivity